MPGFEGKPGRAVNVANWASAYDPDQPTPAEIVEAKLDGVCPRCARPGDFGDEGYCVCGFAY